MSWCLGRGTLAICWQITLPTTMKCAHILRLDKDAPLHRPVRPPSPKCPDEIIDRHRSSRPRRVRARADAHTTKGRKRAAARGVTLGHNPMLTPHQQKEATKCRDRSNEAPTEIAQTCQGPGHPAVLERYSAGRTGERPCSHLDGISGYLHADAFAGYEALCRPDDQHPPRRRRCDAAALLSHPSPERARSSRTSTAAACGCRTIGVSYRR